MMTIEDMMYYCMIDGYEFRIYDLAEGRTVYEGSVDDEDFEKFEGSEVQTWDIGTDGWLYFNI